MQKHNATAPNPADEFDSEYAKEQMRRSQQPIRRFVKSGGFKSEAQHLQIP